MKNFYIFILVLAYLTLIGFIIYFFKNPWWSLMLLFIPMIKDLFDHLDNDDEEDEFDKKNQLNG